ncbi:MAG: cytochrome c peroxidase [Planctomycetota bacterium]
MRRLCLLSILASTFAPFAATQTFKNFESAQLRPIAVSFDGTRLLALNTPDRRLAVYDLSNVDRPWLLREVQVGMGAVSLRQRTANEVWVVNNLSDSITVVDIKQGLVVDTIQVQDEPYDVVFANDPHTAGNPQLAFVSLATSKQIVTYDATTRQAVGAIAIFGEEPRALATDGEHVWCAIHHSGNGTTVIGENVSGHRQTSPTPGLPSPTFDIAKLVTASTAVQPDFDVFEIHLNNQTVTAYQGVGTTLFDLAVHPVTKDLWVANTDAQNTLTWEPHLKGKAIQSRVTQIQRGGPTITPFPIDANPTVATALSQPTSVVFDPSGTTLYVAAFGSDRIGVMDLQGNITARVDVGPATTVDPANKRGSRGLAHHPTQARLYVLNKLNSSIRVINTHVTPTGGIELPLAHDPTLPGIKAGRGFLYDARLSGNGTMSCASCHIDGDTDGLAWDLGDPLGGFVNVWLADLMTLAQLHPMKGPMVTQTLRGLGGTQPFHWRGDRPTLGQFNIAFQNLLGGTQLNTPDLALLTQFMSSVEFAPNPNRNINDTLPPGAAAGKAVFTTMQPSCASCHDIGKGGTSGQIISTLTGANQPMKVAQLRNIYKKQGRTLVNGQRTSGFGMLHSGEVDHPMQFLQRFFSNIPPADQAALRDFVLAFPTGTPPAVGHSMTLTPGNYAGPAAANFLSLMFGEAAAKRIDLIATGQLAGLQAGLLYAPTAQHFVANKVSSQTLTLADLQLLFSLGQANLTFIGVPWGSGLRMALDRDLDGTLDGDEGMVRYGTSTPAACAPVSLTANSTADLGNAEFAFVGTGAPLSTTGFMLLGSAQTSLPFIGTTLLVSNYASLPANSDASGTAVIPFAIPNDPLLSGASYYAQLFFPLTHACAPSGLVASQGLQITVDA